MSVLRWDPFRDAMKWMFEEGVERPWRAMRPREVTLAVDMYETDENVVIQARIPGVRAEDVAISLLGDTVTIRGNLLSDAQKEGAEEWCWIHHELWHGPFARVLELPGPVQADKAEANFENGLLTLIIPKAEETKAKVIKVSVE
jgi:HSP20 family protein